MVVLLSEVAIDVCKRVTFAGQKVFPWPLGSEQTQFNTDPRSYRSNHKAACYIDTTALI